MDTINIQEFNKLDIRVGLVEKAENAEGSEKLIRLTVDFGAFFAEVTGNTEGNGKRIIFTGVRPYGYNPGDFQDKKFLFVTNLEPKKMMGEESQGMILAVDGLELPYGEVGANKPIFIEVTNLPVGAKVR